MDTTTNEQTPATSGDAQEKTTMQTTTKARATRKPATKGKPTKRRAASARDSKQAKGSVIPAAYKKATKNGEKTDKIGKALREYCLDAKTEKLDPAKLKRVARENHVEWRWDHVNVGMQRMNLGNVLRHLDEVKIGGQRFN